MKNKKSVFIAISGTICISLLLITIYSKFFSGVHITYERSINRTDSDGIKYYQTSEAIELKRNNTFVHTFKEDISNENTVKLGKYKIEENLIHLDYDNKEKLILYKNGLSVCFGNSNCNHPLVESEEIKTYNITDSTLIKTNAIEEILDIALENEKALLILKSETCYYCREYVKVINEIKELYDIKIYYYEVSVNADTKSFEEYFKYEGFVPHTVFINNYEVSETYTGIIEKKDLEKKLDSLLYEKN